MKPILIYENFQPKPELAEAFENALRAFFNFCPSDANISATLVRKGEKYVSDIEVHSLSHNIAVHEESNDGGLLLASCMDNLYSDIREWRKARFA